MNKKLEYKLLQKPAEDYLNYKNILYIHLQTSITRIINKKFITLPVQKNKGFPDLIIFLSSVFFVEFKLKGQKLTKDQKIIKRRLELLGYTYYVIYNIDYFIKLINKKLKQSTK